MLTGNQPIKRCIEQATKNCQDFRIELVLWHGDGTGVDIVYKEFLVIDNATDEYLLTKYYGHEGQEKDTQRMLQEQQRLFNFLCKNFKNVTKREQNV
jgi:hypothetical protein